LQKRPSLKLVIALVAITLAGFAFGFFVFQLFGPRPADKKIELPPVTLPI
jgi:hypothetical protein